MGRWGGRRRLTGLGGGLTIEPSGQQQGKDTKMATDVRATVLWGMVVASIGGCGWPQYESRMQASAQYFDYLGIAQSVLVASDDDSVTSFGVQMRVPSRFRVIPSTTRRNRDGEEVAVPADQDRARQPRFARSGLPGLLGSWYSEVSNDSGKKIRGSSRMYLFGNYQRYRDRADGINVDPQAFSEDLVNELADAVGVAAPGEAEWQYEKVEKIGGYYIAAGGSSGVRDNHFTLVKMESRGTEYRLYLYPARRSTTGGEVEDAPAPDEELQFALLFVVPRKVVAPARLESGIKYCLEWFEAVTDVPSFDGPGDGGGSDVGF